MTTIFTAHGDLEESLLTFTEGTDKNPPYNDSHWKEWRLTETGELVKREVHIEILETHPSFAQFGAFNGDA